MGGETDAVVYIHIDAGGKEGTLADDLQWRVLYDQRIDDHDQHYCQENGKTNLEFPGLKDLLKSMFHDSISPQSSA